MPELVKVSRAFKMEWERLLQYRTDLFLWTLGDSLAPLIALAIWFTVARSSATGLAPTEVLSYYLFGLVVWIVTGAWGGFFMARQILDGEIAKYLVRPFSIFWHYAINNNAEKIVKLAVPIPLLVLSLIFFPSWYVSSVYIPLNWLFFLGSLVLAVVLSFILDMALGMMAFWFEDAFQIRSYFNVLEMVASGMLVPLIVMPGALQLILNFFPFRYIIGAPIEIIVGQAEGLEMGRLFIGQVVWIAVLSIVLRFLWTRGLKRYAVPGQ